MWGYSDNFCFKTLEIAEIKVGKKTNYCLNISIVFPVLSITVFPILSILIDISVVII